MDKIICLGKNYEEHARELGDAIPEKPVLFLKPPSILRSVTDYKECTKLSIPRDKGELHHEIEVVIKIKKGGQGISVADAKEFIEAVSIGLDMTLRDLQAKLKKAGHPWTTSKVFPDSAIVGNFIDVKEFPDWRTTPFALTVNEKQRQQGSVTQMIMSPEEAISYVSSFFPLVEGDLLFTGTPAGVGAIKTGDKGILQWNHLAYSVQWQ